MTEARYYVQNPYAPEPNQPPRFGTAVVICAEGRILLEQRRDNLRWGIVSGDIHANETFRMCAIRRTFTETGIHLRDEQLKEIRTFDDPSRIVSFFEGNIYRLIHIAFYADLKEIPETVCGKQSVQLKWVEFKDLEDYELVVTHQEIIEEYLKIKKLPYSVMPHQRTRSC